MMRTLLTILCIVLVNVTNASEFLFDKGKSDYTIVLPDGSSSVALQAARDLQEYIKRISGVELPIKASATRHRIIFAEYPLESEGYQYYTKESDLYLKGMGCRGLLYCVYAFLEQVLDVHWFTTDCTQVPSRRSFALPELNRISHSVFRYRLDYYYGALNDNEWCAHNLLNTQNIYVKPEQNGGMESWWGAHTFSRLLPVDTYYDKHPEYFSLRSHKRVKTGQLCLSNPKVLEIVSQVLLDVIKKRPGYYVYDVSQNDNLFYCQCDKCEHLANQFGGQSGLMLWFVNQVANRVEKVYPDKMVGTFAYRYTRALPRDIVPARNVAIRLCSFECCFCHSLETCERNQNFLRDLQAWSSITPNVHIWDYCVGFMQYVAPHPYFAALQSRYLTYQKYKVQGILELGQYESEWGDFSELRQWLVAKLLWDPQQNVDSLAQVFINGYYGNAAAEIMEYYQLTQGIVRDDAHFTIYCDYKNHSYSDEYLRKGRILVDSAREKVNKDTAFTRRVNRVAAQIYYLQTLRSYTRSVRDGTYERLKRIIEEDPTYFIEHKVDLQGALKHWGYI